MIGIRCMEQVIKDGKNRDCKPMLSIVVPIYKVEKYLNKCIDSILAQTFTDFELILVNDGSPDRCREICDYYEKKDKRIKVIHKANGGLSSARNAGINIAIGEYIGFVDSDDYIEPFMYERLIKSLQNNNCLLSVCAINYVFENGKSICKVKGENDKVFNFSDAILEMNTYRLFDMGAWSKVYHKSLFNNLRFPVGKLSEDFYIMYKIFDRAQKISYVATPCYNYLQRQNSISRNTKINHDFEYAAKEQMEYLERKYPELTVLAHTSYASAALTVYDFYLKNHVKCSKEQLNHFKKIIRENYVYISKATYLSKAKKIQFALFMINPILYKEIFLLYRKFRRI